MINPSQILSSKGDPIPTSHTTFRIRVIYRVPFSVRLTFTDSDELQFFAIFLFALYCKIVSFFYPIHLPTPLLQIILRTSRSSFSFLIFPFLSFSFSFLLFYISLFSFPHAGDSYLPWRCKLDKKIRFLEYPRLNS
jgi:hypothetical protein